jgi:SAM-dependent methyltransferase
MDNIYTNQEYLRKNPTWHDEDSPWKASQIMELLARNKIDVQKVAEIGCGAGGVIKALADQLGAGRSFQGFDISPEAIRLAERHQRPGLDFSCEDLLLSPERYDLLLVIDVIEHIPDYLGFTAKCQTKARYKIYHIPLDIHVSSVLRARFVVGRRTVGHLHYFSAESALDTVNDTGHKVIDYMYTDGGVALAELHPSFRRTLANFPRKFVGLFSKKLSARWFGGYSLLVLAE